jgi:steroid delta-isomerase-like uncharacterized protein
MLATNTMNSQDSSLYHSYLLRLWRDSPHSPWRASLQSAATEAMQHFATVDELWSFLMAQMNVEDMNHEMETKLMSTEANKTLVRRTLEEFFNGRDMTLAEKFFAADFVNHNPNLPHVRDLAGLKQLWQGIHEAFPDHHTTIDHLIAEGDQVAKRSTLVATHQQEWNGIPATGKQITIQGITIYRIVNGKIVELWWGYDSLGVLQQLGVVPAAA